LLVATTQHCVRPLVVMGRLVSGYSLPPPTPPTLSRIVDQMARPSALGDGRECALICCVMGPVLTAAEPAVMHVISANTTVADTIRYDTPSIGSYMIPIR